MLDPFSRGAIVGLAALCVAGTFALDPLRVRGSVFEAVAPRIALTAPTRQAAFVSIARDPFAEPAAPSAPVTSVPAAPPLADASGERLPSNLANDVIPALPGAPSASAGAGAAAHVTAVVTGAHPYALVENDGVHEIKGIGDRIGGIPVTAIDLDGIRLQSGARLTVTREGQP
jgi:hypothetical protein